MSETYKIVLQPYQPGQPYQPTPLTEARTEATRRNKFHRKMRELSEKQRAETFSQCQVKERDDRQLRRAIEKPKPHHKAKPTEHPTEKWRNHLFKLEKRCALVIKKDHDRLREERQKRRLKFSA